MEAGKVQHLAHLTEASCFKVLEMHEVMEEREGQIQIRTDISIEKRIVTLLESSNTWKSLYEDGAFERMEWRTLENRMG